MQPVEILVPGRGMVNASAMAVDTAVQEYDELLRFGFNPANSDWVVYRQLPRDFEFAPYYIDDQPVLPVLGFGTEIPSPEQALKRLYETDAWRHGQKLYDNMLKENERIKKEQNQVYEDQMEEALERAEHALRYENQQQNKIYFQNVKRRRGYRIGKRK